MFTGEQSFFTWGTSCILNPYRPPVKGWTPPEFHGCHDLDQTWTWLTLVLLSQPTVAVFIMSTVTVRWDCFVSQSPKLAPIQFLFHISKFCHCYKDKFITLKKILILLRSQGTAMIISLSSKLLTVCLPPSPHVPLPAASFVLFHR